MSSKLDNVNWKEFPHSLVNKRVHITWKSQQIRKGRVIAYNNNKGLHEVEYDDGDIKFYDMSEYTFRIVINISFKFVYFILL
jgi:hypothetical protein